MTNASSAAQAARWRWRVSLVIATVNLCVAPDVEESRRLREEGGLMICPNCGGDGLMLNPRAMTKVEVIGNSRGESASVVANNPHHEPLVVPCDICGGSGRAHCCEGECAEPGGE